MAKPDKKEPAQIIPFPVKRWPASSPDPELSIPDLLDALASDIRKGRYAPQAIFIGMVHPQSDGTIECPYVTVNLSPLELGGLLARFMKVLA